MFRRKPNKDERYVRMREALYRFLWDETNKPEPYYDKDGNIKVMPAMPMPDTELQQRNGRDAHVQQELKKLLG